MPCDTQIILIDDESDVLEAGCQAFQLEGFSVQAFNSACGVLDALEPSWPGVVITDVKMPGQDGLSLMREIHRQDAELPVIIITGHGDIAMAVQSIREGAYDFIEKPFHSAILVDVAKRALEKRHLTLDIRRLQAMLGTAEHRPEPVILGDSPPMARLRAKIGKLARTSADVLITGETGTGKELVARALHVHSERSDKRFVVINCGAIPETIIESELFGHEAGAFTGAKARRVGKFEYADGGTIFLDEIESMAPALQVRLLRVLQERVIERLGSNKVIPIDVRVISATKTDLLELSRRGEFREDLYYRLNVANVTLPPLRDRKTDIGRLFQYFVAVACERYECPYPKIGTPLLDELGMRDWEGNVRELQNEALRFVLQSELEEEDTAGDASGSHPAAQGLVDRVNAYEAELIRQELRRCNGNLTAACKILDVPRKTLYYKLEKHGISREQFLSDGSTSDE